MIVICEPLQVKHGHEKVNSGFIHGLRLAYPQDKIVFYADITHIEAIKSILVHDNITINNIEYIPIKCRDLFSIVGLLPNYFLFNKIFHDVIAGGTNKIFFLSFTSAILYILKKLKQKRKFLDMRFALVLHGDFENIADKLYRTIVPRLPDKPNPKKPVIEKIRQTKLKDLPLKAGMFMFYRITKPWQFIFDKLFQTKRLLIWEHSADFRYIALSPHIIVNAEKFIDVKKLNVCTVVLPTVFVKPTPLPNNKHVKFATFGTGDSFVLHKVAVQLSKKELNKTYEIRIIGRDNRGTDGFLSITCPGSGKILTRGEMKKYAQDIDMFLILYEKNRYRLSCTGSILESLSYMKPILHFNNDCINNFNRQDNPIGICCNTIEEFVNIMEDIIENYQAYIHKLQTFRKNILNLRKEFAIENSVTIIKDSFTW